MSLPLVFCRKTAIEAELMKCKGEVQFLTHQLLEAIQQKVELSQELEAWQEDMQLVINQQLKAQQQDEKKRAASHTKEKREATKLWNPFQRSNNSGLTEKSGFFSIFNR
ncbi:BICD family-like cargo adapter 2 [Protopterus annectens]|uniref:BICD family-like cargo adapter 2 n=1 Tax=Protopterus annectens TaxID=7888 RepID=UPI001CFA9A7D|nr:BICD family-like cargo adapter 2 [Protopterus annectens]